MKLNNEIKPMSEDECANLEILLWKLRKQSAEIEKIFDLITPDIEEEIRKRNDSIDKLLLQSVFIGGSVNFYNPYGNYKINTAHTVQEFHEIKNRNPIDTVMVFIRPDGTAIIPE